MQSFVNQSIAGAFGSTERDQAFEEVVANVMMTRSQLLSQFIDPRRDINKECGYPETGELDVQKFKALYDRMAVATRVVEVLPVESWKTQPTVYEDEDPETTTEFEAKWDEMCNGLRGESWFKDDKGNPVWEYLLRADILSGIGKFGVVLLGLDDGKAYNEPADFVTKTETPATPAFGTLGTDAQYQPITLAPGQQAEPGTKGERRLLFIRTFDESLVQPTQYEADIHNPRFGQPVMYNITLNDPNQQVSGTGLPVATIAVHWTRVIHIADNLGSSEIFGTPRMQPVLNHLLDLVKLYGGSGEMYWRGAFPGLSLETHPQLGGDVRFDPSDLRRQMEQYMNGLQRFLSLTGMSAKTLAPQVVDPTPQVKIHIEAICIKLGIPVRIFMGSERGELASSQDAGTWNDRLMNRQLMYLSPRIIVPFIDRLIKLGVLPQPKQYSVVWPSLDALTAGEQADVAVKQTQAATSYVQGGVYDLIPPLEFFTKVCGWTDQAAKAVVEAAKQRIAEEDASDARLPGETQTQGQGQPGEPGQGIEGQDQGTQEPDQADQESDQETDSDTEGT